MLSRYYKTKLLLLKYKLYTAFLRLESCRTVIFESKLCKPCGYTVHTLDNIGSVIHHAPKSAEK